MVKSWKWLSTESVEGNFEVLELCLLIVCFQDHSGDVLGQLYYFCCNLCVGAQLFIFINVFYQFSAIAFCSMMENVKMDVAFGGGSPNKQVVEDCSNWKKQSFSAKVRARFCGASVTMVKPIASSPCLNAYFATMCYPSNASKFLVIGRSLPYFRS